MGKSGQQTALTEQDVCVTWKLNERPRREVNLAGENAVLQSLAEALTSDPSEVLQRLVDTACDLCGAESCGVSLIEPQADGTSLFRWVAMGGRYKDYIGGTTPIDYSPCGNTLRLGFPQLYSYPGRFYESLSGADPVLAEGLVVPIPGDKGGPPVGTIWVAVHSNDRGFDLEDVRVLTSIASFTGAALRMQRLLQASSDAQAAADTASKKLAISEGQFLQAANSISQLAWIADETGWIYWYNQRWYEYTGTTLEDNEGWGWQKVHDPVELQRMLISWRTSLASGEPWEDSFPLRRHDGEMRWHLTRAEAIRDENGKVVRWFGTNTDIEDQKRAEDALRESERQFRHLANAMPQVVWTARPDGVLDYVNDKGTEYSGGVEIENGAVDWTSIVHPDDLSTAIEVWTDCVRTGKPYEIQQRIFFKNTGEFRWNLTRALPVRDKDGRIVCWYGTNTDIEDQKRAEVVAREKDISLRTALRAGRMGTWDLDVSNQHLSCSKTCNANYGVPVDEELTYQRLFGVIHPDDRERWQTVVSTAITNQSEFEMEYRVRWPDASIHWVYVRGTCTAAVDGRATAMSGVSIDITERKRLEEAARHAQENAESANLAKSEFLANMSHEIRTPMNAVIGLSTLLGKSEGLSPRQKSYVQTLQVSADSLLGLINDLLDISKIEARSIELEHIPFSLTQMLNEVISMMAVRAREKGLDFSFDGESQADRTLIGDPTRVRQIILNLCSNAIKFTAKGGVKISVAYTPTETADIETVSFSISDTGIGISPEQQGAIFQKFIQADTSINRRYGGTGLGLAITKTLTELMGGEISIDSEPDRGSTFTVSIPFVVANQASRQVTADISRETPERGVQGQRVLLVEDYEPNVLVAGSFLESMGYSYDVAENGHAAVDRAKSQIYLAILMDVQMHGLNGLDATKLIRDHENETGKRRVPIIGMTAHALKGDRERCLSVGMDDYLSKPYNPDELGQKLSEYSDGI